MTDQLKSRLTRRARLKNTAAAAATAALLQAVKMAFPGGAFAALSGPETMKAVLGYIALTDASPLIVAKEKGFFAKHGVPAAYVDCRKRVLEFLYRRHRTFEAA